MKKVTVSALLAAPTLMAGAAYLTPTYDVQHLDYKLVDEALVIIPVDNAAYADAAADLYLKSAGFEVTPEYGNVATLDMPEVVSGGTLNDAVNQGVNQLVGAIEADYNAGDMAGGPLYVFGYSQSSVVMGMAEQQLAAYDNGAITPADLNFVMVGDSASAEGGFLTAFIDEMGLYPTEVYSLSGDGWTNYDYGLNDAGLFSDHLEYLGLTPQEIGSAGPPVLDGVGPLATEYFTIQDSMVNSLEALWTQLQIADSVLF
jgi:hypothetical protein